MRPFIQFSILLFSLLFTIESSAQDTPGRWQIKGVSFIEWPVEKAHLPYTDNIEMAGKRVASIVEYSVDTAGYLSLNRQVFFPQIHPFIKSTDPGWYVYRAYSKEKYGQEVSPRLYVAGKQVVPGKLRKTTFNGILSFEHHPNEEGLVFHRKLFPSSSERLYLEVVEITNKSDEAILLTAGNYNVTSQGMEADGTYETRVWTDVPEVRKLEPGASLVYHLKFGARKAGEEMPDQTATEALAERSLFLGEMATSLRLETPDKRLNVLFELSKIRASESIFESKLGPIHSPGGGRYYVGIWANDQAEYISPFFPYLGYDLGNESAMSTYRAFAGEMNDRYEKIRYAFEVEGTVPPFLLDRGDAAMIAYGASQYALALGDRAVAEELWPLISWCLEYNHRQLNEAGVVKSESDEMEGRIETGTANLSTSSLYYGALDHASDLAASLGKPRKLIKTYEARSKALSASIEGYFGATVEGLDTYKYYKEHQYLRHWICLPLVVGINDRKDATIEALFERLWTSNGVHVEKNSDNEAISKIFWDRGTLYALRGTFLSGATETSLEKLQEFTQQRLLGDRVPYVVEAYPEGNMAHLSAESGLYCRVFIEGMFGLKPTGLDSFTMLPRLPEDWDEMALRNMKAFGKDLDIEVKREGEKTMLRVRDNESKRWLLRRTLKPNEPVKLQFR